MNSFKTPRLASPNSRDKTRAEHVAADLTSSISDITKTVDSIQSEIAQLTNQKKNIDSQIHDNEKRLTEIESKSIANSKGRPLTPDRSKKQIEDNLEKLNKERHEIESKLDTLINELSLNQGQRGTILTSLNNIHMKYLGWVKWYNDLYENEKKSDGGGRKSKRTHGKRQKTRKSKKH